MLGVPPPPSPVIFEMTKLTPENYVSLESRKGINSKGYLPCLHTKAVRAMFLGLKFHLKAIFGSKICNMNFPFLGGKDFQQLPFFSRFIFVILQK